MRNILLISASITLLTASLCISCSKETIDDSSQVNLPTDEEVVSVKVRSDIKEGDDFNVSKEQALIYAQSFKGREKVSSIDTYLYEGIPTLYVINFEKGWMVIPTDARIQTVLGESEEDSINVNEIDNDGIKAWLDLSAEYVFKVKNGLTEVDGTDNLKIWEDVSSAVQSNSNALRGPILPDPDWVRITIVSTNVETAANQDHLLQTKWGQSDPWYCSLPYDPHYYIEYNTIDAFLTGCVPTAVSQVLYYYHNETGYPNDFYYSVEGYISQDLENTFYKIGINRNPQSPVANSSRWNSMPLTSNDSGNFSYVSDLMMEVGYRMNATYSAGATIASMLLPSDVAPCGITSNSYYYTYETVRDNIVNRKPVLITATHSNHFSHAWVIDGCVDITTTTTTTSTYSRYQSGISYSSEAEFLSNEEVMAMYPDAYDGMTIVTNDSVYNKYLLMNWGCDGNYDTGHYAIIPSGNEWRGYTNTACIIYNISTSQLN